MANITKTEQSFQQRLENELEKLKKVLGRGYDLKVKWLPGANSKLSGEVRGEWIYIYDEDFETAMETLKHEIVDYAVSEVIEPYMQVTNKLIALMNERSYQQKERLVETLIGII